MRIGTTNGNGTDGELDARLSELFVAYRAACPEPAASVNFMPEMWAKIEARKSSSMFGRLAKALVTAAIAASMILGTLAATAGNQVKGEPGNYLEVLAAEHASALEPLSLERVSLMEQQ